MVLRLTTAARDAMAEILIDQIDGGGAAGTVRIYSGTQPANPSIAATGTILSENVLSYPCGTVTNGVLVFGAIAEDQYANASGTATWCRFFNSADVAVADASVSVAGGSGDVQLNTTAIVINSPVRWTSLQWTMPG